MKTPFPHRSPRPLLRLLASLLLLPLLASCDGEDFTVPAGGVFSVTEQTSGAAFTATIEGESARCVFSLPRAAEGLSAETADGVTYTLSYSGVDFVTGGFAVETAANFKAALTLLRERGKTRNGAIEARADKIYAKGKIKDGALAAIDFFDGKKIRKYKIHREDETWTNARRQG